MKTNWKSFYQDLSLRLWNGESDTDVHRSLILANQITDCNVAFFDVANNFAGCIVGLHEVLRRQGLLEGLWTLDKNEKLSPGQKSITFYATRLPDAWRSKPLACC